MPLLQLFSRSPDEIFKLELGQIIALCGNGQLSDASPCSEELREFLRKTPSEKLFVYAETCLLKGFDKSGFVLQDVVNELGRRLEYSVTNGLYQGRSNAIGFDGLWRSSDGKTLVVEVKTTDTYRVNLDTISSYRKRLIESNEISTNSSILIVVGRQDTGDLEAQVRGSRHAWDIRLISLDALAKLVKLREETEQDTVQKIRELLTPFEYTRVDKIIDIAFTAAVEATTSEPDASSIQEAANSEGITEEASASQDHTPRHVIEERRQLALNTLAIREGKSLVKRSRATYWSSDDNHDLRAVCSISKRHTTGHYWYAYHPAWDEFLRTSPLGAGFFVLGCVDRTTSYAIPRDWLAERLPYLNRTEVSADKSYWHIHLESSGASDLSIRIHKKGLSESLSPFALTRA